MAEATESHLEGALGQSFSQAAPCQLSSGPAPTVEQRLDMARKGCSLLVSVELRSIMSNALSDRRRSCEIVQTGGVTLPICLHTLAATDDQVLWHSYKEESKHEG